MHWKKYIGKLLILGLREQVGVLVFPDPHRTAPLVIGGKAVALVLADLPFLPFLRSEPLAEGHRIIPIHVHRRVIVGL